MFCPQCHIGEDLAASLTLAPALALTPAAALAVAPAFALVLSLLSALALTSSNSNLLVGYHGELNILPQKVQGNLLYY